jgi:hypothetical protein
MAGSRYRIISTQRVGKMTVEQIEDVESLAREVHVSLALPSERLDEAMGITARRENVFTIRLSDWQRWVKDDEARRDLSGIFALLSVELLNVEDVTPEDREPPEVGHVDMDRVRDARSAGVSAGGRTWVPSTMYRILTPARSRSMRTRSSRATRLALRTAAKAPSTT